MISINHCIPKLLQISNTFLLVHMGAILMMLLVDMPFISVKMNMN